MASTATSSSSAALSLYEKYTQLNHQLDDTREKRSSLQKQVQDTRERLEEYETHDKPALRQATQEARQEAETWQEQLDTAQEDLATLQSQRDVLARSRDRLEQESWARRAKQRMDCRNFLVESEAFRQRHCPQVSLQLSMMASNVDETVGRNTVRIARLRAVALANGLDAEDLPEDVLADTPIHSRFEGLEIPINLDEIDWDLWVGALGADEELDDDDIRQKLADFGKERELYEASKIGLQNAKENLRVEVVEKYDNYHRYKEQLETKLQRLSKEIQQLEVDISTTLATHCLEEGKQETDVSPLAPNETSTTRRRVVASPPEETVLNPYRRRSNNSSENSARCGSVKTTRAVTPAPPPPPPVHVSSRSRNTSSRKRKSAFGSSVEIGGAEVWSTQEAPSMMMTTTTPTTTARERHDILLGEMEDSPEDDELLAFSPFHRDTRKK